MAVTATTRSWIAVGASVLALAVGSFIYSNHAASDEGRNFCALIGTFNTAYQLQPPTTATGRLVESEMAVLYERLNCPPVPPVPHAT